MNKQELRGVPNSSRNISLLKGRFEHSRVLWLTRNDVAPLYDNKFKLHDYFDLIVVQNRNQLATIPNPDIFVHWDADINSDIGIVDQSIFSMEQTLFCVHYKAAQQMKKRRWKLPNYMLSFKPDFFHPELTICSAIDSRENCFCSGEQLTICLEKDVPENDQIFKTTTNAFMSETNKYRVPSNMRIKDRPLLMEVWS